MNTVQITLTASDAERLKNILEYVIDGAEVDEADRDFVGTEILPKMGRQA